MVMANQSSTNGHSSSYVDRDEGMREGNRRNVAAVITQGLIIAHGLDNQKALESYYFIHDDLVQKDQISG